MMNNMMGGSGMWLMAPLGLLLIVLVLLGIVALAKYIFFSNPRSPGGAR